MQIQPNSENLLTKIESDDVKGQSGAVSCFGFLISYFEMYSERKMF